MLNPLQFYFEQGTGVILLRKPWCQKQPACAEKVPSFVQLKERQREGGWEEAGQQIRRHRQSAKHTTIK